MLACYPNRLLTPLQETGLIDDQDTTRLVSEVRDDLPEYVVAHGIWVPVGVVEEVLDPSSIRIFHHAVA